jgi:hypothetical protein
MKSRLTISIIGCTLLTLLTPTILLAQPRTDAEYPTYYGTTRRALACPSRSEPRTGRLTVAQATTYIRCLREGERQGRSRTGVNFLDIANVQLSPPHRVTERDSLRPYLIGRIDKTQPMYEVKAQAVYFTCTGIYNNPAYPNTYPAEGKNCKMSGADTANSLNSYGACFKDLTGQWLCQLTIVGNTVDSPPPE